MSGAPHVAVERSAWVLQAVGDPAVKLVPLRVAVAIAQHLNAETRDAWPSQVRIAELVGSHRGNVAHAVAALVRLGHLQVEKDGRGNRYRLAMRVPGDADGGHRKRVWGHADKSATCFPENAHSDGGMRVSGNVPLASPDTRDPRMGARANSEEQRSNREGGARSAAPHTALVDTVTAESGQGRASAPECARLPGRLVALIEEALGQPLHAHQHSHFIDLLNRLGREEVVARLAAYQAGVEGGAIQRIPTVRWLRQAGLVGVANVA